MNLPLSRHSIHRIALVAVLSGVFAGAAFAQSSAAVGVRCTVRIRPAAAADYDLASEVVLRGHVVGHEGNLVLLRIPAGTVRVDAGAAEAAARIPLQVSVEVTAAKWQDGNRQRLLAREIRFPGETLVLRDGFGAPLSPQGQL